MEVSESDAREQVSRLVRTDLFRFSELQRRLLSFLCDKSLSGEADLLKEYTVAVDGLGKPETFDPRRDATVRLQSSKLRQRIVEYYRTAGQNDDVLIDFPRGHFKLTFSYRARPSAPPPAVVRRDRYRVAFLGAAAVSVGFAVLCGRLFWVVKHAERQSDPQAVMERTPALSEFWAPFLAKREGAALVCVGTPLFIRINNPGFFLRDSEVNNWAAAEQSGMINKLRHLFPNTELAPWHNFTGTGEAEGAFLVGDLLSHGGLRLHFANSDQLTWNQIGEQDVVFVGPPKFISQLDELPAMRNLAVESDGIRNLHPQPNQPVFWKDEYTDPGHYNGHTHALISRLPGLHGEGAILILGGSWTQGSLAASQYVTRETYVAQLLSRIRLASGKVPAFFEAVLSVTTKGSTPVDISYEFHRVLTPANGRIELKGN